LFSYEYGLSYLLEQFQQLRREGDSEGKDDEAKVFLFLCLLPQFLNSGALCIIGVSSHVGSTCSAPGEISNSCAPLPHWVRQILVRGFG